MQTTFEAALSWDDELLAFLPHTAYVRKCVQLEERGERFGLLEVDGENGWILCIPDGAEWEASVDDRPLDGARLPLDASGERRLPLCAGLRARVRMGEFRFEVRPAPS